MCGWRLIGANRWLFKESKNPPRLILTARERFQFRTNETTTLKSHDRKRCFTWPYITLYKSVTKVTLHESIDGVTVRRSEKQFRLHCWRDRVFAEKPLRKFEILFSTSPRCVSKMRKLQRNQNSENVPYIPLTWRRYIKILLKES